MAKDKVAYRRKDFGALVLSFSIDPIEALGRRTPGHKNGGFRLEYFIALSQNFVAGVSVGSL